MLIKQMLYRLYHLYLQFTVKPDNPGKLQVLETNKNTVTLGWARPSKDGGNKIQGYVVEYKKTGEHWAKHNEKPIAEMKAKGTEN